MKKLVLSLALVFLASSAYAWDSLESSEQIQSRVSNLYYQALRNNYNANKNPQTNNQKILSNAFAYGNNQGLKKGKTKIESNNRYDKKRQW
ncbi:MAG: hypothetical protein SOW25_06850 [Helicobacter sp.]|nr:hypothetical protein [Helicobacteraceae bacterium]MDY3114026.1 hypothetical protein [Helicobacter sp.]